MHKLAFIGRWVVVGISHFVVLNLHLNDPFIRIAIARVLSHRQPVSTSKTPIGGSFKPDI